MRTVFAFLLIAASAVAAESKVDRVIVTFKTHFDIGYTDMAAGVVQRYRTTMIDQALKVVDQSRPLPPEQQFVWTIPGWPMSKIVEDWPGQSPDRTRRVMEAFRSGRFVVHALPFTTHTETLEPEDLVRGLGFSSRLSRSAGLPLPRDAKMTDVPCHSWILPTLLRHAGVDFLHLGCNAGSRSPHVPRLFWWEGPDGSRLLTMYTAESYGTGLVAPADWPCKTWLALIHTGDNHGPPTPDEVKKVLDEGKKLAGVKVRIGRLSDFADAILAEKPNLPVVRGDMPDSWIQGPMCNPDGAALARATRPKLVAAASLNTLLRLWKVAVPDGTSSIAEGHEKSLLYGEHTWGGAQYWITSYGAKNNFSYGEAWKKDRAAGRFKKLEESWAEHTGYIEKAQSAVAPVAAADLAALASAAQVDGPRLVVYNPLPWPRDGIVAIPEKVGDRFSSAVAADDPTAVAPITIHAGGSAFLARAVSPLGYRTYRLQGSALELTADSATVSKKVDSSRPLENRFFKVTLDPAKGTVASLIDKRTGRELVDPNAPFGFGQHLYERMDRDRVQAYVKAYGKIAADWVTNEFGKPNMPPASEVPYRAASPERFGLRVYHSPLGEIAEMTASAGVLPYGVTTQVTLPADQPYIELSITLDKKPADPWPEAGWLCLPVKASKPQFHLGRLGGIVDPARDVVPGSNHNLWWLNGGLTITGEQGGMGICPIDHPAVALDVPGCWKYSPDFVPQKPIAFINLFNNQWTTNFRMWNEGTWTSRVRIWPVDEYKAEASLITPAWEARMPLMAAWADGKPGPLPPKATGIELSRRGVLLTAFGKNPDGDGLILRLWEQAGQGGPCQVKLPEGLALAAVQPVNLRGQPQGEPLPVVDRQFTILLPAFAPATVMMK